MADQCREQRGAGGGYSRVALQRELFSKKVGAQSALAGSQDGLVRGVRGRFGGGREAERFRSVDGVGEAAVQGEATASVAILHLEGRAIRRSDMLQIARFGEEMSDVEELLDDLKRLALAKTSVPVERIEEHADGPRSKGREFIAKDAVNCGQDDLAVGLQSDERCRDAPPLRHRVAVTSRDGVEENVGFRLLSGGG